MNDTTENLSAELQSAAPEKQTNKILNLLILLRNAGIILGVPTIIVIGIYFHNQQVEVYKAQIENLKLLKSDEALKILKSEKEINQLRVSNLENRITQIREENSALRSENQKLKFELEESKIFRQESNIFKESAEINIAKLESQLAKIISEKSKLLSEIDEYKHLQKEYERIKLESNQLNTIVHPEIEAIVSVFDQIDRKQKFLNSLLGFGLGMFSSIIASWILAFFMKRRVKYSIKNESEPFTQADGGQLGSS